MKFPDGLAPGFLSESLDTRSSDGRNDMLLTDLDFIDVDGARYRVPALSDTDGGSSPRPAWLIPGFEPTGKHWFDWILHDGAYRGTLLTMKGDHWTKANLSRAQSDSLLDRSLTIRGMGYIKRRSVRLALKAVGWRHFRGQIQ